MSTRVFFTYTIPIMNASTSAFANFINPNLDMLERDMQFYETGYEKPQAFGQLKQSVNKKPLFIGVDLAATQFPIKALQHSLYETPYHLGGAFGGEL